MSTPPLSWQRRAARLGWIAAALGASAVVLLGLAVWALATGQPRVVPIEVVLPVNVRLEAPRPIAVLGLGLTLASFFIGMAALQTAAAMRVLERDRRIPPPLSRRAARYRRTVLGPTAARKLPLELPAEWPAMALPERQGPIEHELRCTVLVPAHDEEAIIAATLASLAKQTRRADRVIVIADNCTDATVRVARERGVEVVETVGNTEKKGGALNQVLGRLLPETDVRDVILVMDADSTITIDFLETALGLMARDADLMAVGGLFSGEQGSGIIGQLQRNEFTRYRRVVGRREGRLFVLTGTGSMFRAPAMRAVVQARGRLIPGTPGQVYDTLAMTEDNEITLALKTLGAKMISPARCGVTTEVMPSWFGLRRQRLRWQRGALENVGAYGLTRTTAPYWGQQLALAYGVVALNAYLVLMAIGVLASDAVLWSPFWVAVGGIFALERVVTVWSAGWRARLLAAPLVLELPYSAFLQWSFVGSLVQIASGRKAGWNEVPRQVLAAAAVPPAALLLLPQWSPVPSSVLQTAWFEALALFVGINTLIFAGMSVLHLLPPVVRTYHRVSSRLEARRVALDPPGRDRAA